MPAALHANTEAVALCVEFEELPCQSPLLSSTYTYEKNPTISLIKPTKSYLRFVARTARTRERIPTYSHTHTHTHTHTGMHECTN